MRFITALVALVGIAAAKPEHERVTYLPEMGNFD